MWAALTPTPPLDAPGSKNLIHVSFSLSDFNISLKIVFCRVQRFVKETAL